MGFESSFAPMTRFSVGKNTFSDIKNKTGTTDKMTPLSPIAQNTFNHQLE
jgi:hypothetical protein